ncbi:MAG: MBL fold metallo-hydrolase [Candidatus Sericytochromatia bacterium]|uniref:MBL fold metallo-hydrolase n=1 Tax=Candidatus Tanganyikabacteria bacterium TaxID=2961651 RepID=A0A938BNM3_9BACT|nr:MBL fold metallo-hydrolase [Candidatus Tanganyikabacteria bacterium]
MPLSARRGAACFALLAAYLATALGLAGCAKKRPHPAPRTALPYWIQAEKYPAIGPERPLGARQLAVRWYGTAAFEVRTARGTVFFDPNFTRDPLGALLFGAARAKPERWRFAYAQPTAIFIGHAHFDHFLDAPEFAKRTGATLYASDEALRVARSEGVPERQLSAVRGGQRVAVGDMVVEVLPGRHSEMVTQLLAGGSMPAAVKAPLWFLDYKNGPTYTFLVRWRGRTLAHIDSADFDDAAFSGHKADVALFAISGWTYTKDVFARLYEDLGPDVFVPMHHDDFFAPLSEPVVEGPLARLKEAYAAIGRDMPGTAILPNDQFFGEFRLGPLESP